jgi:folate-binding protein YgfZ
MTVRQPAYDAARRGAVVIDRSGEGRLRITGADRVTWLQGLLTNDIAALAPGQGCYAAYLTPQGRMISDLRVLATEDAILLDVPAIARAPVLARLEQFIITEDVLVEDVTPVIARLGLHGPRSGAVLETALGSFPGFSPRLRSLAEHAHAAVEVEGAPVVVAGARDIGVPGIDLYCDAEQTTAIAAALFASGAVDIDAETWDTLRIEAGRPLFGLDMDTETIPLEAGIEDRAISQTKGCYVGQEIVIRILHRGGGRVARRLVGLVAAPAVEDAIPVPAAGTPLRVEERDTGRVTSAAWSPALGRLIALGYVHRDLAVAGSAVALALEPPVPLTVSELPFVGVEQA